MPDLGGATVSLPGGTNIAAQGNPVAQTNPLQQLGGMADTFAKLAQVRQIQANVAQTQMQIAKSATDNLAADVASVPIDPKNPDSPDVLKARMARAAQGVTAGRYGPMGAQIVSSYGGNGGFTDDVTKRLAIESGDASLQQAQGMAPIQYQNIGPALVPTRANPVLGTTDVAQGPALQTGPSGGELDTPAYSYWDPTTNQMRTVTKRQAMVANQQQQNAPGGPQGGATAPPAGFAAGPPAGVQESLVGTAKASTDMLNNDRQLAQNAQASLVPLNKVNELLQTPEGQTGPGTQVVNGWRDFMLANAPWIAGLPGMGGLNEQTIKAATQDQIKKYMVQMAGAAAAQYGEGTNEKLAIAASGNANPDLSNLANRDVTRMSIALSRAAQAKPTVWDQTHGPADVPGYSKWATNWALNTDPRAFMLDLLSPQERATLGGEIAKEGPQAQRKFITGMQRAEQAGFYTPDTLPR